MSLDQDDILAYTNTSLHYLTFVNSCTTQLQNGKVPQKSIIYYIRTSPHQYSISLINKISLHPVSWQYLSILLEYTPTVHYIAVLVI